MNKKETAAKIIRTISIPPVLITSLLLVLYAFRQNIFNSIYELFLAIIFLAAIPITAYPLQPLIPMYMANVREGQRNLSLILSLCGYSSAVLYGIFAQTTKELLLIFITYLLAIIILLVFNKIIKFRSSGHACGISGPLILFVYYMGWMTLVPCFILFGLICWASVILKRHTIKELIGGCASGITAFALSYVTISIFQ